MKPNQSTMPINSIQNWLSNVPKELMTCFEDMIKAMNNWEEEIFNYFNSPITNAYTESLNRLIKTMNHVGRGYSFEALRAKILFTQGYRKFKKKFKEVEVTFGKMLPVQFPSWSKIGYEWVYEEIYGADFPTLTEAIEEGTF